jgi:malate dehydrogenase (oxaloacetate-decarboxylating)(NADP+)
MFIEAARAVADQVSSDLLKQGLLYPLQSNILETEVRTAARVAKLVFDSGLAQVGRPTDMVAFIREHVYTPEYKEQSRSNAASRADRRVAENATIRR